jgi:cyclopropane fatty-acyl-phospholipid synthase-like methyltransferase
MACPLCKNERYFVTRKYPFAELQRRWIKYFRYDPFTKFDTSQVLEKRKCVQCDLIFYHPSFFGEKDFYERIAENSWYYEENKWEFDRAIELVGKYKPNTLLEIGCGNGSFLEKAAQAVGGAEGTEINAKAILACQAKGLKVTSTSLNSLNKQYDIIVSFEVFEHLDGIADYLRDALDRLKPHGLLLIAVPNPNGYFKEMDMVLLDLPPHHNLGFSRQTFDFIAEQHHLEILHYDLEPLRYIHYLGYLHATLEYNRMLLGNSFKNNIMHKVRTFLFGLFAPLTFVRDRQSIVGQTHLVLFRKP